ncbi:hypothetical protein DY000_02010884 [Brassica cretica]|uniref:RRM domain-containing protein n=2 Tax=Brassica cretica TaxID=69181 RepID=A0ABQ7CKU0_BRACR|nr:hypothetical protein DY000_02010884 [Brassica cretica]
MSSRSSRTIYVGNLPGDIREREVEDLFSKYGPVVQIDLKIPPRPPGYAFVEFEDPRDADDAIHGRDGYDFDGHCLRVELAHGGRRSSNDARGSYGGGSRGGGGGRDGGDRGRGPSRRSEYRVVVSGLPSSASWQDLKDHMRKGGEVCFSQVFRDGRGTTGIVDYTSYEDMKYAIKKLDDTEFRNAYGYTFNQTKKWELMSGSLDLLVGCTQTVSSQSVIDMDPLMTELGKYFFSLPGNSPSVLDSHGTDAVLNSQGSRSRSRSPLPPVQKEASKSPTKVSPAKSPMRSRSRSKQKRKESWVLLEDSPKGSYLFYVVRLSKT